MALTQTTDTCTNNFCVWSDVFPKRGGNWTLSEGNRKATYSSSTDCGCPGSIGVSGAGTWYYEITASSSYTVAGLVSLTAVNSGDLASTTSSNGFSDLGGVAYGYYANNGYKLGGPSNVHASYGATFANTDVIGVAFDAANGTLTFYKNGATQGTAFTGISTSETWFPFVHTFTNEPGVLLNNGQTAFAHTPPTGYVGINTANLFEASAPTIEDGTAHHQTFPVWTGNAGSQTVTQTGNSGFEPDWAIIKSVSFGSGGNAFDSVRGGTSDSLDNKGLAIFDSGVEDDNDSGPAFGASAGKGTLAFTGSGNTGDINHTGRTYVGWTWLGGNGNTTPSGGTRPTTCSVNQTAGFSIVGWEGNNTNEVTIAHGLNNTPAWILYRKREGSQWFIQHAGMTGGVANGSSTRQLVWDSVDGQSTGPFSGGYIDTVGSSTVRLKEGSSSMNNCNASGDNYIAYMFADIAGYSSFSSYEGNGVADGPLIETGFKPAWLMIKNIDVSADTFVVFDNINSPFNVVKKFLQTNLAYQQIDSSATGMAVDFLSNGFKVRGTEHNINESTKTHIYMAFAEHPFAGTTPATAR